MAWDKRQFKETVERLDPRLALMLMPCLGLGLGLERGLWLWLGLALWLGALISGFLSMTSGEEHRLKSARLLTPKFILGIWVWLGSGLVLWLGLWLGLTLWVELFHSLFLLYGCFLIITGGENEQVIKSGRNLMVKALLAMWVCWGPWLVLWLGLWLGLAVWTGIGLELMRLGLIPVPYKNLLLHRKDIQTTSWLAHALPEDWCGELEALRYQLLIKQKRSNWFVRFITIKCLLEMLWAYLQIKVENIWLSNKNEVTRR